MAKILEISSVKISASEVRGRSSGVVWGNGWGELLGGRSGCVWREMFEFESGGGILG